MDQLGHSIQRHHQKVYKDQILEEESPKDHQALMMSPRSEMKRLQPQCQTQRSNEDPIRSPELPIFPKIKKKFDR